MENDFKFIKKESKEIINFLKNASPKQMEDVINYLRGNKYKFNEEEVKEIVEILVNKKANAKSEALVPGKTYENGRTIVYTSQVPYEIDILNTNIYMMTAIGALAATVLGIGINYSTLVRGFPCVPISPPGLAVLVGSLQTPDIIYSLEPLDATNYGIIPPTLDTPYQQFKQGFNYGQKTFDLNAPVSPGNSVIHLIEVSFVTEDVDFVARPYFNPINPAVPINISNYSTRTDIARLQIKFGTESTSPVPPTPDAGYVGLYYITLTYGQTAVITSNITVVPDAPFVSESLTQKLSAADISELFASIDNVQQGTYTRAVDVGTPNVVIANPAPPYTTPNCEIYVFMENTNTGASTLNVNGLGSYPIRIISASGLIPLDGGEMVSSGWSHFKFDGTHYQLLNPVIDVGLAQVVTSWGGSTSPVAVTSGSGISITGGSITNIAPSLVTAWDGSTSPVSVTAGIGIDISSGVITNTATTVGIVTSWDGSTTPVDVTAGAGINITDGVITNTESGVGIITSWNGSTSPVAVTAGDGITITGGIITNTGISAPVVASWNGSTSPVNVTAGPGITINSGIITNTYSFPVVTSWNGSTSAVAVTAGVGISIAGGVITNTGGGGGGGVVTSWNGLTTPVAVTAGTGISITGGVITNTGGGGGGVVISWNGSTSPVAVTAGSGINIAGGIISSTASGSVAPSDIQESKFTYATDVGTTNAYAVTLSPPITIYNPGTIVQMIAVNSNTGASTLNVNGLGAPAIYVQYPNGIVPLSGGEIVAGNLYNFQYNGSQFILLNPSSPQKALIARVRSNIQQALTTGTVLQFQTVDFDPYSWWDGSPNYTFNPTVAGYYFIQFSFKVNSTAGYEFALYKNGVQNSLFSYSVGSLFNMDPSVIVDLNGTTDTIYLNGIPLGGPPSFVLAQSTFLIYYLGS